MNETVYKLVRDICCILFLSFIFLGCKTKNETYIENNDSDSDIAEYIKESETLTESTSKKFSYDDLKIGAISYLMNENKVKTLLGEPSSIIDSKSKKEEMLLSSQEVESIHDTNSVNEMIEDNQKIYSYDDLTLIFTEINGEYLLTTAASARDIDIFARGLSVGDTLDDILNAFYYEQNCFNEYYYTEDRSAIIGNFLYGNTTMDNLEEKKINNVLEYGLINYNGNSSLNDSDSYMIEYTFFDDNYIGDYATISDNFAQLFYDLDENNIITSIRWYYYPEEDSQSIK